MTRAAKIFWLGYIGWLALVFASAFGLVPVRWYFVLVVPPTVAAFGFFAWVVVVHLWAASYDFRAWLIGRRRR